MFKFSTKYLRSFCSGDNLTIDMNLIAFVGECHEF